MGNLLLYLCIVVLSSDVCYDVYASEDEINNRQVLLRKLRQVVEGDPDKDTGPSTVWNDVVAKEMVAKVIPFPRKKDPDESSEENKPVILKELTSCLSGLLLWYKNNVYDVFFGRSASGAANIETETSGDPKEEVEIIEPRYHGRVCEEEGCNGAAPAACPEGETRNSEGICVNSRMILSGGESIFASHRISLRRRRLISGGVTPLKIAEREIDFILSMFTLLDEEESGRRGWGRAIRIESDKAREE
ncbi:hypothetical protein EVAR_93434_1 [Eumeta japonica]|uniref:Uncharacterized protein n=1 Tax=Eumeta variegata TaxID=151549 RepID=A0A4C1TKG9_EUMVA|nr:hypothetical protein EVAR_93434_1 [Eumeta japonica]